MAKGEELINKNQTLHSAILDLGRQEVETSETAASAWHNGPLISWLLSRFEVMTFSKAHIPLHHFEVWRCNDRGPNLM